MIDVKKRHAPGNFTKRREQRMKKYRQSGEMVGKGIKDWEESDKDLGEYISGKYHKRKDTLKKNVKKIGNMFSA